MSDTPHPHQPLLAEARDAAGQAHRLSIQDNTKISDAGVLQRCRDVLRQLADALEAATKPDPAPDAQGRIHAPDLYARLSQLRPKAEVEAAVTAFGAEVRAARNRHGLRDVVTVILTPTTEGDSLAVQNNGDVRLRSVILAHGLAQSQRLDAEALATIVRQGSEASGG